MRAWQVGCDWAGSSAISAPMSDIIHSLLLCWQVLFRPMCCLQRPTFDPTTLFTLFPHFTNRTIRRREVHFLLWECCTIGTVQSIKQASNLIRSFDCVYKLLWEQFVCVIVYNRPRCLFDCSAKISLSIWGFDAHLMVVLSFEQNLRTPFYSDWGESALLTNCQFFAHLTSVTFINTTLCFTRPLFCFHAFSTALILCDHLLRTNLRWILDYW